MIHERFELCQCAECRAARAELEISGALPWIMWGIIAGLIVVAAIALTKLPPKASVATPHQATRLAPHVGAYEAGADPSSKVAQ